MELIPNWLRFDRFVPHGRGPVRPGGGGCREHVQTDHAPTAGVVGRKNDFLQRRDPDPGGAADSEPVARGQARATRLGEEYHRLRLHRTYSATPPAAPTLPPHISSLGPQKVTNAVMRLRDADRAQLLNQMRQSQKDREGLPNGDITSQSHPHEQ